MVKYFAYGSNMNKADLDKWCDKKSKPGVDLSRWQKGVLYDYRLDFTHYSNCRKGGVADVLCSPGDKVEGVLFDISEAELKIIAEKEGEPINIYRRILVRVSMEGELDTEAVTFQVFKPQPFIPPHSDYLNIIIDGAKSHQLSNQWIEELKQIPTRNK